MDIEEGFEIQPHFRDIGGGVVSEVEGCRRPFGFQPGLAAIKVAFQPEFEVCQVKKEGGSLVGITDIPLVDLNFAQFESECAFMLFFIGSGSRAFFREDVPVGFFGGVDPETELRAFQDEFLDGEVPGGEQVKKPETGGQGRNPQEGVAFEGSLSGDQHIGNREAGPGKIPEQGEAESVEPDLNIQVAADGAFCFFEQGIAEQHRDQHKGTQ